MGHFLDTFLDNMKLKSVPLRLYSLVVFDDVHLQLKIRCLALLHIKVSDNAF